MHIVIKNTKSIEEYKQMKTFLEEKAQECFESHKQAVEDWQEGEIEKVWIDGEGNICIEYTSGNWWHYRNAGKSKTEWW